MISTRDVLTRSVSRTLQAWCSRAPFGLTANGSLWRAHASRSSCGSKQDARDAVVRIHTVRQRPGWTIPWQTQPVDASTGSGAIISLCNDEPVAEEASTSSRPIHVLTAAHVIADAQFVQVQLSSDRFDATKRRAHILAVCHDADLALLKVDPLETTCGGVGTDPFRAIKPLKVAGHCKETGGLPRLFEAVHVVGYPIGSDSRSITEGVVSRVEVVEYSHSFRPGLALTVDAAINSGNSGGPLLDVSSEQIIGIAFQKLVARGIELQGHAVPAPLIRRFLDGVRLGRRGNDHLPSLGCDHQTLEAPAMRRWLKLDDSKHSGVLINRLHSGNLKKDVLRVGDVLWRFGDFVLDNFGFCEVFNRRLPLAAARDLHFIGDTVELAVIRNGQEVVLPYELRTTQYLVPRGLYDHVPAYLVSGGLVWQPLTLEYLQGWKPSDRPVHLQNLYNSGHLRPHYDEVVVLTQILADEVNQAYGSGWVGCPILASVNGEAVSNMKHLAQILQRPTSKQGFLQFELTSSHGPFHIVLDASELETADERICKTYQVPSSGSPHFHDGT